MALGHNRMNEEKKERIIKRIEELTILLGGKMTQSRQNYRGRLCKHIGIEYDIEG